MNEQIEPPASERDDPQIPDDEIVYRRVSYATGEWVRRDPGGKLIRAVSGGFHPSDDGLSVFRSSVLQNQNPPLGPSAVALRPSDIVVGFSVRDIRNLSLGIRDDAWPTDVEDSNHSRYAAHSLIVGWMSLSNRERIRRQKGLATAPSIEFVFGS